MKDKQCYYTVAVAACQVYKYSKTINPTSVGVNCEPHNTSYQKVLKNSDFDTPTQACVRF